MNEDLELEQIARRIRNQKAKEWRAKNKEKIQEINKRYWLKKAKERLSEENSKKEK